MSQRPTRTRRPAQPGYQRTFPGLVAAMLVVVLVVVGWTVFRALISDKEATPVRTVDWKPAVAEARADHALLVPAPPQLPEGWRATSVTYRSGPQPAWHLGLLTDSGKYVGVEEQRTGLADLVEQYVDPDAVPGDPVQIGGQQYQTWSDAGGDYAVGRSLVSGGTVVESWLVVGSASPAEIRSFAGLLRGGELRLAG